MTLSDRVAAASGPDRELDLAIERAVGTYTAFSHYRMGDDDCEEYVPTRYTASIDSAMTLVPEGWFWTTATTPLRGGYGRLIDREGYQACAQAATPALALTAAALKSRNL